MGVKSYPGATDIVLLTQGSPCTVDYKLNKYTYIMTEEELVLKVVQWGEDKGILSNSTPSKQLIKTMEESLEFVTATQNDDLPEVIDAIGDITVTYILYLKLIGEDPVHILVDREKVVAVGTGLFSPPVRFSLPAEMSVMEVSATLYGVERIKELIPTVQGEDLALDSIEKDVDSFKPWSVACALLLLDREAQGINTTLKDCLNEAYKVISKRTGKMVDGLFVKD